MHGDIFLITSVIPFPPKDLEYAVNQNDDSTSRDK